MSLQPELFMVALWPHVNPYFPCPQCTLQAAWKPLLIPVQGPSQHLMAPSSLTLQIEGGREKAAQSEAP